MINNQVDTDVDPNLKDEVDMEVDVNDFCKRLHEFLELFSEQS